MIPANSVPWRSGRAGIVGWGCATAPLPGLIRSIPGSRLRRRYGCDGSIPVSSSATVTPVPSNPGISSPRTAEGVTSGASTAWAGTQPARGYTLATSRSLSRRASAVGSSRAENPLSTRTYRYSGATRAPAAAIREKNCSCSRSAAVVQLRICASVACPPAMRTRLARRGLLEQDDVPLSRRDGCADTEHALPARLVDRRERGLLGMRARAAGEDDQRDQSECRRATTTQPTHTHPSRGSADTEAPRRSGQPRRSSPHCPCTGRAARSVRRAALHAVQSSPRRPRRRRHARAPTLR